MRKTFFLRCLISLSLVVSIAFSTALPTLAASKVVSLYIGPSSATVTSGTHFPVQIRLNKNDNTVINYVSADLNFPADKLSVASISVSGGYFTFNGSPYTFANFDNNAGTIDVGGQSPSFAQTGDFLVATVNFVAKNSGSGGVNFNGRSKASLYQPGANQLTGTAGGVYIIPGAPTSPPTPPPAPPPIPAPAPSPPPTPSPAPVKSSSPVASNNSGSGSAATIPNPVTSSNLAGSNGDTTSTVNSSSNATTKKLSITNPQVSSITQHSVKLNWNTSLDSGSTIKYGEKSTSLNYIINQNNSQSNHSVLIDKLSPNTKIYYEITAVNNSARAVYKSYFVTSSPPAHMPGILLIAGGGLAGCLLLIFIAVLIINKRRRSTGHQSHTETAADVGIEALAGAGLTMESTAMAAPMSTPSPVPQLLDLPATPVDLTPASVSPAPNLEPSFVNPPLQPYSPSPSAGVETTQPTPANSEPISDEPDMFELGEQRLQQEERDHLI